MPPSRKRALGESLPVDLNAIDQETGLPSYIMDKLEKNGLGLREHQKTGISTLLNWKKDGHGGIMGDEMGLGKTCQAILVLWEQFLRGEGPFLVLCPTSVVDHFASEVNRFSCGELKDVKYFAPQDQRPAILQPFMSEGFPRDHVLVTPYHIFKNDVNLIKSLNSRRPFTGIVIDEAQSIKNRFSQLHQYVVKFHGEGTWFLLMTGTPIQNDIGELYSLLSVADPKKFPPKDHDLFIGTHSDLDNLADIKEILKQYMIRRLKEDVMKDMPVCEQVVVYHGVSEMQTKLYMDIMRRNHKDLRSVMNGKTVSLINLLVRLRQCVGHPYTFKGIEPQPFEEGEHIVEASGKFIMLDRLLNFLKKRGHRCLIFSQFLDILDILQDYLTMRGYDYERIDGGIRAEERFASMTRFNKKRGTTPFVFILSTRAGGLGVNLVGADTAIFLDSDWNPQADLQAMARCHRIGQTKPVRVIRLVGRYTVEQYMQIRARAKLKLSEAVIGDEVDKVSAVSMLPMLVEGLGVLKNVERARTKDEISDKMIEDIVGRTDENGCWMPLEYDKNTDRDLEEVEKLFERVEDVDALDKQDVNPDEYLYYQGATYRQKVEGADFEGPALLKSLVQEGEAEELRKAQSAEGRSVHSNEELAAARVRRAEAAKRAAETRRKKLLVKWEEAGYVPANLPSSNEAQDDSEEDSDERLRFVYGDVTRPQRQDSDSSSEQLIVHVVDNGGVFGTGGVFTALHLKDPKIAERYELIAEMQDMRIGDAHLIENVNEFREVPDNCAKNEDDEPGPSERSIGASSKQHVALLVAQSCNKRDEMRVDILAQCFKKLACYIKTNEKSMSVHLPRIGYGMSRVNWYAIERIVRDLFCRRGIPTYVYYFKRSGHRVQTVRQRSCNSSEEVMQEDSKPLVSSLDRSKRAKRARIENEEADFSASGSESDSEASDDSDDWQPNENSDMSEGDAESELSSGEEEDEDDLKESYNGGDEEGETKQRSVRESGDGQPSVAITNIPMENIVPKQPRQSFRDCIISVIGVFKVTDLDEFSDLVIGDDGFIVSNANDRLMADVTHVVVPEGDSADEQSLFLLRTRYPKNVVLVAESWMTACTLYEGRVPTEPYLL